MDRINETIRSASPGDSIKVGSSSDCDISILADTISDFHCAVVCRSDAFFIRDLDSRDGTFINGAEVLGLTQIHDGDVLRLGTHDIRLEIPSPAVEAPTVPPPLPRSNTGLSVQLFEGTKTVTIKDQGAAEKRNILDAVTLAVDPNEFISVVGASGSGKSTLVSCLAGFASLSHGSVAIDGEKCGNERLMLDRRIAYLPQDVVIHEALPAKVTLDYIIQLKDISHDARLRQQIIEEVLDRVGMLDCMNVPVERLSGGQRKRIALAAQLIGGPQVLLLDEVTSGLDPATEEEMMHLFKSLASEGKTVVCVTHNPSHVDICDRLAVLMHGKLVFYGTPEKLREFFQVSSVEKMYAVQGSQAADEWEAEYQRTAGGGNSNESISNETIYQPQYHTETVRQTSTLVKRYLELLLSDAKNLFLLLAQAPVIALMIAATYGSITVSFAQLHAARTKEVTFLLILSVLWCAGTSSVREVVKECAILKHELRFGVGLIPYLLSKFLVLSVLAMIQATLLFVIVDYFTNLPGSWLQQWLVLLTTSIVGVVVGLLISSVSGTSERAMTILPVFLVGQAIFSGGLARLEGAVLFFAKVFAPAYWGLDGLRATLTSDLNIATYPGAPGHYQPPILGPGGPLLGDLFALLLQSFILLTIAYVVLHMLLRKNLTARWPVV